MADKESIVQKAVKDRLTKEFPTIYLVKIHQSLYSKAGIPDLLGCINGRFIAIEVKTSRGRLSKLQERELRFISEAGGLALVCYGKEDIERIADEVRAFRVQTI